jgi:L-2-hydroxyglutarate oxidase LhgO
MVQKCDVLILGAGVVGLATGIAILESSPSKKVIIAEKEKSLGLHASGRNSGVLHAGFYYSPDSLKARFCRDGNIELRRLAKKYSIPVLDVGKVVVTQGPDELSRLNKLFDRGVANGVNLEVLDASRLQDYEPLATTYEKFLWSPSTAISDPQAIIAAMCKEFIALGGKVDFNKKISLEFKNNQISDVTNTYDAKHVVNAAGAQADRISRSVGVGTEYAMLPFMGVYQSTTQKNLPLQRLVYPVPHPVNPFLGVHFSLTLDRHVKIGPTAIPIAGREQYSITQGWSASDIAQALRGMGSLIQGESHDFGEILKTEWPKIFKWMLIKESAKIVPEANMVKDWHRKEPGIRAQLVHLPTGQLEQDFVINTLANSTHILNSVSPGWTTSLPFGRFIKENINLD